MTKKQVQKKTVDPCLRCNKVGRQTPEGKRFCDYCRAKEAYLDSVFDAMLRYTFYEDDIMQPAAVGIKNRTQMWSTQPHPCPKCKLNQWRAETETYVVPQQYKSVFAQASDERIVMVCANCGHRIVPGEHK
jgi:predicted nucleic-acid-binding Zn-ribbon protein